MLAIYSIQKRGTLDTVVSASTEHLPLGYPLLHPPLGEVSPGSGQFGGGPAKQDAATGARVGTPPESFFVTSGSGGDIQRGSVCQCRKHKLPKLWLQESTSTVYGRSALWMSCSRIFAFAFLPLPLIPYLVRKLRHLPRGF